MLGAIISGYQVVVKLKTKCKVATVVNQIVPREPQVPLVLADPGVVVDTQICLIAMGGGTLRDHAAPGAPPQNLLYNGAEE